MGRIVPGDIPVRPQPHGAAIQEAEPQAVPATWEVEVKKPTHLQGQDLGQASQRQTLAGVAEGGGGGGKEPVGQALAERIGAAGLGIGHDGLQGVIGLKPLKDEVPKGHQGGEEAFIKTTVFERRQAPELPLGKQAKEPSQQRPGTPRRDSGGSPGPWAGAAASRRLGPRGVFFDCAWYVSYYMYIPIVKTKLPPLEFRAHQLRALWPALKGSLSRVHKPCIRPRCRACARGTKHRAWLLAFTQQGRRRCMYVPKALVPVLRQALQNGRKIEALLYQVGPELIRGYRRSRREAKSSKTTASPSKSRRSTKNRRAKS